MKKFTGGLFIGVLGTLAALFGGLFTFKKTVVDPIEDEEEKFDDNRRKAMRKSRSAHQG
ncbi:DUF3042 domain-containing protein [Lentilactobacillus curieae]|uniref:DUF3042 domain-containing protein n=1 Tax=Lentilactobacillus curieae TaxID=1138822 RepID=A0A1S6QK49_9LACO|nr:DUF3042 family protein [Lentilactobacillus curieae]AQW21985.1 DUF3042 domain-containing protein [Lentilactobacillus curieae]